MTCLIIDTSTELCLIALVNEAQVLCEHIFPHLNLLSKNLLPQVHSMLEKNGLLPSDLSCIAAGIGPGSYTGTRLGATVAKSLGYGLNIRVKPFSSPLAFLPPAQGSFAFLLPTRSGLYYILKDDLSTDLIPEDALLSEVKSADYIVFSAARALPECLKEKPRFAPEPNLSRLIQFLTSTEAVAPEKVEIQYFHTPF